MVYLTRKAEFSASHFYHNPEFTPEIINRDGIDAMDHRFHTNEVAEFKHRIPTTENLAISIWLRLQPKLSLAELHRVRVYETPDLFVDYYGEA